MEDNSACLMVMFLMCVCVFHARTSSSSPTACTRMYVLALAVLLGLVAYRTGVTLTRCFHDSVRCALCVEKGSEGKRKTNERSTVQDSLHNACNKGCTRCTGVFSNVFVDEQRVVRDVVCILCVCLCSHVFASKEKKHEAKTNKCSWNQ